MIFMQVRQFVVWLIREVLMGYLHSVVWSAGLECWTGVLDWSTGMESLEWSEALEWTYDHLNGYG